MDCSNRAGEAAQGHGWFAGDVPADQILRVQRAEYVVDRPAVHRQPREWALGADDCHLRERRIDVDGGNFPARHHELLRLLEVQPQSTLQPPVLVGFEEAAVPTLGKQQLDFVRRMEMPVRLYWRSDEPE